MPLYFLILANIIMGIAAFFRLRRKGHNAKWMKMMFIAGVFLTLGGCASTLGWLGAETSGRPNIFHEVNPLAWWGIYFLGIALLIIASIISIRLFYVSGNGQRERTESGDNSWSFLPELALSNLPKSDQRNTESLFREPNGVLFPGASGKARFQDLRIWRGKVVRRYTRDLFYRALQRVDVGLWNGSTRPALGILMRLVKYERHEFHGEPEVREASLEVFV